MKNTLAQHGERLIPGFGWTGTRKAMSGVGPLDTGENPGRPYFTGARSRYLSKGMSKKISS